ncbi:SPFH domain-containing protein [Xanthomonadaceae bacterium JHOS43]|nr:SPFH domain-containing protein [Xanthomonadaceae bacterium JHOS43]MCX7564246.1 SPFH domain-containing protein [Xanthomonadaceae bacterium XH05]
MELISATLLLPLGLMMGLMLAGMRYVPEDTVLTVHRFGRYVRTLMPGLRFTLPMLDKVVHRVRLVGHQVEVPLQGSTAAHADVYYQILEPERTGDALERIDALVERHVRQALSALLPAHAAEDADGLAARLKHDLNDELATLGLHVTRCNLRFGAAV